MLYVLCIFVPPLAVLLAGWPVQAIVNLLLCFLFVIPGIVHAFVVVNDAKAQKRHNELLKIAAAGRL